jgi:SPP1 gp7 family putative phage head morphogenesis protein
MVVSREGRNTGTPERPGVIRRLLALVGRGDRLAADQLEAYERTRRELLGAILSGTDTDLTIARNYSLLAQVDRNLDRLVAELKPLYTEAFTDAAAQQVKNGFTELREILPKAKFESLIMPPRVNTEMVNHIIREGAELVKTPIEALKVEIRRELTQSMIQGESIHKAAKRILAIEDESGARALPTIKPFKRAEDRATTIARTEMNKASNAAHLDQLYELQKQLPTIIGRWSSAMCGHMCKICAALNGKKAKPGDNFPGGISAPPRHPNCRCTLVSEIMSEADYISTYGPAPTFE